ncbi:MAG TPA: YigZ family protein [Anaerolineales bacterium]|nr:YigZ family protein [Anaerolineales bacterium]
MRIPAQASQTELVVVNSRFIAIVQPSESVTAAKEQIAVIRAQHPTAAHHVPAYIIGHDHSKTEHCSDDGEPKGTAGRPMLAVLRGSGLGDILAVVVRYFGGTKLGTGGLVRAYTEALQQTLAVTPQAELRPTVSLMLAIPYNLLERVRLLMAAQQAILLSEDFAADITITCRLLTLHLSEFQSALQALSNGQVQAEVLEQGLSAFVLA